MCNDSFFTFIVFQHLLFFVYLIKVILMGMRRQYSTLWIFLASWWLVIFFIHLLTSYMFSSIWILCPLKKIKLSISLLLGEFLIYFKYWLLIIFVFCTVASYSKDGLLNKELLLLLWKSFFFWRNAICLFLLLLTAFEFLSLRTIEKAYSSLLSVFYQFQILYLNC